MATIRELMKLGKSEAVLSAPVIRKENDEKRLAAQIKEVLDARAPKIPEPEPRELGAMEPGEQIPMDHPPQDAAQKEHLWFTACHTFETEIGIIIDPRPQSESAWIALQMGPNQPPLLLREFPLFNRASSNNPY
jgi:hypothetical protein